MSDQAITFVVLGFAVLGFVSNRIPVGVVALSASLALYATGVIGYRDALAGFGDPTVVFIAALFIVSEGLDATGVTTWAGQRLVVRYGSQPSLLVVLLLALAAVLSSLISVNGAVAALVPMTVVVAMRLRRSPSELLMPLAFTSHAGSLLALTGTPVNVLIASEAARAAGGRFGFFDFAVAGIPLTIAALVVSVRLAPRLLPRREALAMAPDLSAHARTLLGQYELGARVLAEHEVPPGLFDRESGVAEVLVPPRSELVGQRAFPGMVTDSGDLVVLAIQRRGEDAGPDGAILAAGDSLLLQGTWRALDRQLGDPGVVVIDDPALVRRQAVPLGPGATRSLIIVAAMVVLLVTGAVPAAIAGLLAAMALVTTRVLSADQAYRSVSWTSVVLIAGMIPVSNAIQDTGAAADIASGLVDVVGDMGPHALLVGIFLITAFFGQLVSNTATALIMIPIAVSAAQELDVSARPVLMSLAVASAAAFLTPIATPANLMIMGPGGYRFGDYWRLGLVMLSLFFLVAVFLVPVVWPF